MSSSTPKFNVGNNSEFLREQSTSALQESFKNNCGGDPASSPSCQEMWKILNDTVQKYMIKSNILQYIF